MGELRGKALDGPLDARVEDVMDLAPSTYRPNTSAHEMAHEMADSGARRVLVTSADGVLIGMLRREALGPDLASASEGKEVAHA